MAGKLIKVDKNGSKHYEGVVICDRCGGSGVYVWGAIINGNPQYAGTCFKCDGAGMVVDRWIERPQNISQNLMLKGKRR